ncbi:alpha/beta hydrolase [Streptomyces iconiensis]|uniref:Alpha/beta hydrolase n=1 Tax=Streptomyces iconiensis TaxID=1384038 RepID=A0ABT6ZRL2_9ACTN|nr:alpha/beta hydrolase [Streptomyces iconiensis]MDJ1131702.1 alpha/beta hydrolase [Streptomyces iconiensis]
MRAALEVDGGRGRRLSYLDFGGPGRPLLALHGHIQEARSYALLARELSPEWRVIALDQRGHGFSDRADDYSREGYVADAAALLAHLGLTGTPVVGHSLGGVNAYQLAAAHPGLVSALVIEDIGAVIEGDLSFTLDWPHRAPTRAALTLALGTSYGYVTDSVREFADGWGLAFHAEDMVASQNALRGDHWSDWLATGEPDSTSGTRDPSTPCPALLIRGARSDALGAGLAREMAASRPGARLVELDTGHMVRATDPAGFADTVRGFLREADRGLVCERGPR